MILTADDIRRALDDGLIGIDPPPEPENYASSAVDILVSAASTFRRWRVEAIRAPGVQITLDLAAQDFLTTAALYLEPARTEADGSIILPPYSDVPEVMLGQTHQHIHLTPESRLAGRVEGRSQLARIGLMVHLTAPTIHYGFRGTLTLEMVNHGPFYLKLVPGRTPICQLIFERVESYSGAPRQSTFHDQPDPSGARD